MLTTTRSKNTYSAPLAHAQSIPRNSGSAPISIYALLLLSLKSVRSTLGQRALFSPKRRSGNLRARLCANVAEVIAVHARLIAQFGGSLGIRDRAALESAIARPQSGYLRRHRSRSRCSLGEPLSESSIHRWKQARRRDREAAFLRMNGFRMEFDDTEAFSFLIGLYEANALRFEKLEAWLRDHVVPTD